MRLEIRFITFLTTSLIALASTSIGCSSDPSAPATVMPEGERVPVVVDADQAAGTLDA